METKKEFVHGQFIRKMCGEGSPKVYGIYWFKEGKPSVFVVAIERGSKPSEWEVSPLDEQGTKEIDPNEWRRMSDTEETEMICVLFYHHLRWYPDEKELRTTRFPSTEPFPGRTKHNVKP